MEYVFSKLDGPKEINYFKAKDERGLFGKYYSRAVELVIESYNERFQVGEVFITESSINVIRGMHIQRNKNPAKKIVFCQKGKILDVCVDLRPSSDFGKVYSYVLDEDNNKMIYVPSGFAHGFITLSSNATVGYIQDMAFDPELDDGVSWKSLEFDWNANNPIVSDRDNMLGSLKDFKW